MAVFVSWRDITYETVRRAGIGGIGRVFVALATNGPNKGLLFAIKTFSPNSLEKEDWRRAFMREVHVLRDCNHPAIVKVFDEGVLSNGRPFFVMEYLPRTLHDTIKDGSLDMTAKVNVVMQLLSALEYLSRRDPYVVHRDIKPKNIFLNAGTCVLGDFGLVFQDVAIASGQVPSPLWHKCTEPPSWSSITLPVKRRRPRVTCFNSGSWPPNSLLVKTL
jgi:serine/threonine protein kinase